MPARRKGKKLISSCLLCLSTPLQCNERTESFHGALREVVETPICPQNQYITQTFTYTYLHIYIKIRMDTHFDHHLPSSYSPLCLGGPQASHGIGVKSFDQMTLKDSDRILNTFFSQASSLSSISSRLPGLAPVFHFLFFSSLSFLLLTRGPIPSCLTRTNSKTCYTPVQSIYSSRKVARKGLLVQVATPLDLSWRILFDSYGSYSLPTHLYTCGLVYVHPGRSIQTSLHPLRCIEVYVHPVRSIYLLYYLPLPSTSRYFQW